MSLNIIQNVTKSCLTRMTNHLHSAMSTTKKNLSTTAAIISAVAGPLALAAGFHSAGAAVATLAGVSLAVPPIGMIVAGVVLILCAAYLFTRVTCPTQKEDFIAAHTKMERSAVKEAQIQLQAAKEIMKPLAVVK